ncbi:MAG: hypothetical protein ACTSR8_20335 [Promethearchaeota archaeon]
MAEKKIKERGKIEIDLEKILVDDEIDLSTDEFEEEEEDISLKFEKRKAGKEDIEDSEEFAEVECPFCGELFDDLASHIRECEFADDDVSIDDILPKKKKKKRRTSSSTSAASRKRTTQKAEGRPCPYCGKPYTRLGRHIKACKKRPSDADEEKEAKFLKGEIDKI